MWSADEGLHVGVLCWETHGICWCRIEIIRTPEITLVNRKSRTSSRKTYIEKTGPYMSDVV